MTRPRARLDLTPLNGTPRCQRDLGEAESLCEHPRCAAIDKRTAASSAARRTRRPLLTTPNCTTSSYADQKSESSPGTRGAPSHATCYRCISHAFVLQCLFGVARRLQCL